MFQYRFSVDARCPEPVFRSVLASGLLLIGFHCRSARSQSDRYWPVGPRTCFRRNGCLAPDRSVMPTRVWRVGGPTFFLLQRLGQLELQHESGVWSLGRAHRACLGRIMLWVASRFVSRTGVDRASSRVASWWSAVSACGRGDFSAY